MFLRTFTILHRLFIKYPVSYGVNFTGLIFGFFTCILAFLHVSYEYSYDDFHTQSDQIYRLAFLDEEDDISWVKTPAALPGLIRESVPGVENYVRFNAVSWNETVMIEADNRFFNEEFFMMADYSIFEIFDFKLILSETEKPLSSVEDIVLTEKMAVKLFGSVDSTIGKSVKLVDSGLIFKVVAIMNNWPENSHIKADYLISFSNLERLFGAGREYAWDEYNYFSYLLLDEGADRSEVESRIRKISVGVPGEEKRTFENIALEPMKNIHFQHNRGNQLISYDKTYIYVFLTLGFSVLIITLMNYFNMSSALSIRRLKEIGLRKAFGASVSGLKGQLLLENLVFAGFAGILAMFLVWLIKPQVSFFLGIIFRPDWLNWDVIIFIMLLILISGLSVGLYLSTFANSNDIEIVLKGGKKGGKNQFPVILIALQFTLSMILIVGSLQVKRQMNMIHQMDLGYEYDNSLNVEMNKSWTMLKREQLKIELLALPEVKGVTFSDFKPGYSNWHQSTWWEGQQEEISLNVMTVAPDWIKVMGLDLLEGSFGEIEKIQQTEYVLNEAALKLIGWDTAREKFLSPFGEDSKRPIIGLVSDFNYKSLHTIVEPLVLVLSPTRNFSKMTVKLESNSNYGPTLKKIEYIYQNLAEGYPFQFNFIDSELNALYANEIRLDRIALILTIISVLFGVLGMFSLLSINIQQRTREFAIRQVMGVETAALFLEIISVYFKIALITFMISAPLTYWLLNYWLMGFSYKIDIGILWFVAGLLLMLISILCIGLIKLLDIKNINPILTLKEN